MVTTRGGPSASASGSGGGEVEGDVSYVSDMAHDVSITSAEGSTSGFGPIADVGLGPTAGDDATIS